MRIIAHPLHRRSRTAAAASVLCAAVAGAAAFGGGAGHAAGDSYEVSRLTLKNLVGRVSIETHDAPTTLVRFEGKKPRHIYLDVSVKNDELEIRGKSTRSTTVSSADGKSSTVIVGQSSHVVIGEGATSTVVIGDRTERVTSGDAADWKLTLVVPEGQPLNLRGHIGSLRAGDISAPLDATLDGASELEIGAITSGALKMAGSGTAQIASVDGDLTIELLGAGDVSVNGGKINDLIVKLEGAGDVRIDAPAQRAKLTSVGAGDIEVAGVREKPDVSVLGVGDVSIGDR